LDSLKLDPVKGVVHMNLKASIFLFLATLSTSALNQAYGWTYSSPTATGTCGNLDETGSAADFSITSIINKSLFSGVQDVLKMAFIMPTPTSKNADIIIVERFGAIRYYDAEKKTLTQIGKVANLSVETEDGLVGVAVEKPFKNRVYVTYSRSGGSTANTSISGSFRLSRFKMDPATKMLDMNAEEVILDVPSARNRWHTSGGIDFDNEGNIYWAVGDNETVFTGPGNTNDLRGSVVRVKPNETGPGYTIPKGNFAEHFAGKFTEQGRTALAAEYKTETKVKPEIYIKGVRNAYIMSVNPYTKQVSFGNCGPDYGGSSEAHFNSFTPAYGGWPFWSGSTSVASSQLSGSQYGKNGASEPSVSQWATYAPTDKSKPTNKWTGAMSGAPAHGSDTLPPVTDAQFSYTRSCSMGSLVLYYDGRISNPNKIPPQLDKVWLMGDYNTKKLRAVKTDASGKMSGTPNNGFLTSGTGTENGISSLVDLQQGPDGAIYVVNLGCAAGTNSGPNSHYSDACMGVVRIEYKGTACADPSLIPAGTTGIQNSEAVERGPVEWVTLGASMFSIKAEGMHSIRVVDMQGRVMKSMQGEGFKEYPMPESLSANEVYFLEVKTNRGTNIRSFFNP
jgi:glucose/arabinose dehydrogenase